MPEAVLKDTEVKDPTTEPAQEQTQEPPKESETIETLWSKAVDLMGDQEKELVKDIKSPAVLVKLLKKDLTSDFSKPESEMTIEEKGKLFAHRNKLSLKDFKSKKIEEMGEEGLAIHEKAVALGVADWQVDGIIEALGSLDKAKSEKDLRKKAEDKLQKQELLTQELQGSWGAAYRSRHGKAQDTINYLGGDKFLELMGDTALTKDFMEKMSILGSLAFKEGAVGTPKPQAIMTKDEARAKLQGLYQKILNTNPASPMRPALEQEKIKLQNIVDS